jgi:periplasmic protein TonB
MAPKSTERYPDDARRRHESGTALVDVRLDRSGEVVAEALSRTTGFTSFDAEALALVRRATPLSALRSSASPLRGARRR